LKIQNNSKTKVIDVMSDRYWKVIKNVVLKKEYDEKIKWKFEFNSKWSKLIDLVENKKKQNIKKIL
jgi:hypothetical protein